MKDAHRTDFEHDYYDEASGPSFSDVLRRVNRRRGLIAVILAGVAAAFVIVALATYLLLPATKVTQLNFRLEFRGAERGQYPNGTTFSASEILSAPVLISVFNQNSLGRYVKFEEFKSSLFVIQSNEALESLIRQYKAKLADPKLTAVDRERIEREFQEKKASLSQADYSVALVSSDRIISIPRKLRAKILADILSVWAEQTVKDKGVSLYDISILSSGIFKQGSVEGYDYIVVLDLIRAKINRVIENIDQLLALPGAKVLRTGSDNASLAELRVRLQDAHDFRIRPLVGMVLSKGISTNPTASLEFLQTQLRFTQLETEEAKSRVSAVRGALETYVQERQRSTQESSGAFSGTGTTVIPQIDESFLDRIVQMTGEGADLEYRQKLVNELRDESMEVVPLEAETRYYGALLESFRGSLRTPTPAEKQALDAQITAIVAEAVRTTDEVNEIYTRISKDLNPSTILYSVTEPVSFTVERPVSAQMMLVAGILLLLIAVPVTVAGVLVYDRMQREDAIDDADAEQAPGGSAVQPSSRVADAPTR